MNANPATTEASPGVPQYDYRTRSFLKHIAELGVQTEGRMISSNGGQQRWLIDMRAVFMNAEALHEICSAFWDIHPWLDTLHIAGMETAAIPLVTGLVLEGRNRGKAVSGLIIRKERKKTGLGRSIEGNISFPSVLLVDDILHSGQSAERACAVLRQGGLRISSMFVVIDYYAERGLRWRKRNDISVTSLAKLSDFGLSVDREQAPETRVRFEPAWDFTALGGFPFYTVPKSAPLLVGERLYFGSDSGRIWCLDAATGRVIWQVQLAGCGRKGIWSSPAYHAGHIFIGGYNGSFYCLDAETGAIVWDQPLCEWIGSSPVTIERHGVVVVGLEYARPRTQGSICALAIATGEKIWEKFLRVYQHGSGTYSAKHDIVVCGTNDHNVFALDASSGKVRWRFDTRRSVKYAPAVDDDRDIVAFASFDGSIYVLRLSDGEKLGEFPTGDICYTTPLLSDGKLFCGSGDKRFHVVDLDRMTLIESLDMRARIYSSPRAIDSAVIFGTAGGVVCEIDHGTLQVRGRATVPDAIANAIAVTPDGSRIFVPTVMNEIYAFDRRIDA
jgi:outer membrane protein assembly factor BamB/orotate phosphoribosyltransferase